MILFDFQVDEEQLADDLGEEENPLFADEDLIVLTYFIMPVRLQINGKEFFTSRINKDPWVGLPIVNLATYLFYRIQHLHRLKKFMYDLPEAVGIIQFTLLDNNKVRVVFKYNDIDEIVDYTELLQAFEKFTEKVKLFLNERVPQMREHPYWGAWVRGEEE